MAKAMKRIAQGAAKWEGTKWFSQLSDKCKHAIMPFLAHCRFLSKLYCRC